MRNRDNLLKIYPNAFCSRKGYKQPYIVYDSVHTKNIIGTGNSLKNAYGNAFNNVCT